MIAPRRTLLVRVPTLQAFQRAIAARTSRRRQDTGHETDPGSGQLEPIVLVPTRAAARQLARTLALLGASPALLVTRGEWYEHLHRGTAGLPPQVTAWERDVLVASAIREASAAGFRPPFTVGPGLMAEMLSFYDELRRSNRTVDDFERLAAGDLEIDADTDRGARRLLVQTRFLAATFRAYERRLEAAARVDEHALRARLLAVGAEAVAGGRPGRLIVTVGDRLCDPPGLWPCDYDLMTRLPGLARIEVIATEEMLAAGFGDRVRDLLPGLEELRVEDEKPAATLVAGSGPAGPLHAVFRDREDELAAALRSASSDEAAGPRGRVGLVVRRPLPYLYLARSSAVPFEAADEMPLAVEPFAAALHLVFDCVLSRFTRTALVRLLQSPHFQFGHAGGRITPASAAALNRALARAAYLGDLAHLARLAETWREEAPAGEGDGWKSVADAASIALAVANELQPLEAKRSASMHLSDLIAFEMRHRPQDDRADTALNRRLARGRAAVMTSLARLRDAFRQHDDPPVRFEELMRAIKREIERQTFSLEEEEAGSAFPGAGRGDEGGAPPLWEGRARGGASPRIELLDAQAAAYATLDDVYLMGLVEGEWPERARRSVFYPGFLLVQLGWPPERDRVRAERACFRDLVGLARRSVRVSTFLLEGDQIVEPSSLLEQLEAYRCRQSTGSDGSGSSRCASASATAAASGRVHAARSGHAGDWHRLRSRRTPAADPRFHGEIGPLPPQVYVVTAVEQYLLCPFKYFAGHILRLEEDPQDEESLTPRRRGRFVHRVFRRFFEAWQRRQGGAITVDDLDSARMLFREVVEELLGELPETDAQIERTRLLGSAAASGLGEIALRMEAARPIPVVDRLLEVELEGEFEVAGKGGPRRLRLTGVADRIDLLADGTLRVVDYKLGRAPAPARSVQLSMYACMATQRVPPLGGRPWTVGEAGYLAFGRQVFVTLGAPEASREDRSARRTGRTPRSSLEAALLDGQARFVAAVDGIERGSFPPQPAEPYFCSTCAYQAVCRKDYVLAREA